MTNPFENLPPIGAAKAAGDKVADATGVNSTAQTPNNLSL